MNNRVIRQATFDRAREQERQQHWSHPSLLAAYAQLIANTALASAALYLGVRFILLVNRDVDEKLRKKAAVAVSTALECKRHYEANRCEPGQRAPALEQQCSEWFECKNKVHDTQDSQHSALLWAETLAEIINAFLKPISIKSLLILLVSTCGIIIVSNTAFGSYKVQYYTVPPGTPREDNAIET